MLLYLWNPYIIFVKSWSTQALCSVHFFYVHSNQHVPGFITQAEQLKAKGVDEILLISGMFPTYICLPVFAKTVVLIIFSLQTSWAEYEAVHSNLYCSFRYCDFLNVLCLVVWYLCCNVTQCCHAFFPRTSLSLNVWNLNKKQNAKWWSAMFHKHYGASVNKCCQEASM